MEGGLHEAAGWGIKGLEFILCEVCSSCLGKKMSKPIY